jgi:hypothetical protein
MEVAIDEKVKENILTFRQRKHSKFHIENVCI